MRNSKLNLSAWVVTVALSACGGGGGGGEPAPGAPAGTPTASARSGQMAYFYNNDIYSVNMATGVSKVLANTLNAKPAYVAHSLSPTGGLAIASYSDGFNSNRAPYSRVTLYKPDGSLETSFEFDFEIVSAPSFSPDGQTIALASKKSSGILNDPPIFKTNFSDRSGVLQVNSLSYVTPVDWLPDGRTVFQFVDNGTYKGLGIAKLPFAAGGSVQLVPNTSDAGVFSVSPDGSQIAFTARSSAVTPRHIYMVGIDGSNRRQVTTSRNDEESRVAFSPNGKELLITAGDCTVSAFSGDSHVIQVIPSDATLLDVTYDSSASTVLKVDAQSRVCTTAPFSWK
jgi:Tol biopolymer transport system component